MRGAVRRVIGVTVVVGTGILGSATAEAVDLTIGGAINDVNDVVLIEFFHPGGAFTAFTSQQADATPSPPNGFDPQLQLFDGGIGSSASLLFEDDDGGDGFSADVNGTIFTGGALDSLLDLILAAGDYTLGLSNFDNDPQALLDPSLTLADGYDDGGYEFYTGPAFRLHLLGADEILRIEAPNPVSISGPLNGNGII